MTDDLSAEQIEHMTRYADIHMPPPDEPVALLVYGTNQVIPIDIAAERHTRGLAPLILVTGGVNRHDGRVEGPWMRDELVARGVPAEVIRVESESANTEENVTNSRAAIDEAIASGLPLTVVSKWYHRRAVSYLATRAPVNAFYAIGYESIYGGTPITRENWPGHPDGRRRVIREAEEVARRVAAGELADVENAGGIWRVRR